MMFTSCSPLPSHPSMVGRTTVSRLSFTDASPPGAQMAQSNLQRFNECPHGIPKRDGAFGVIVI